MTKSLRKDIDSTLKAWGITLSDILAIPKHTDARYDIIRYQRSCLIHYLVLNKRMTYAQIHEQLGIAFGTICQTMIRRQAKIKLQLEIKGVRKSIAEWAKITGIPYHIIYYRVNANFNEDEMFNLLVK